MKAGVFVKHLFCQGITQNVSFFYHNKGGEYVGIKQTCVLINGRIRMIGLCFLYSIICSCLCY